MTGISCSNTVQAAINLNLQIEGLKGAITQKGRREYLTRGVKRPYTEVGSSGTAPEVAVLTTNFSKVVEANNAKIRKAVTNYQEKQHLYYGSPYDETPGESVHQVSSTQVTTGNQYQTTSQPQYPYEYPAGNGYNNHNSYPEPPAHQQIQ